MHAYLLMVVNVTQMNFMCIFIGQIIKKLTVLDKLTKK